ncbi:uncharacterized protein LOC130808280 [Amaranthus tricolor]|uniref:uncharacterized protein LOC130808280 n=1 Tax=Amaranthus tricolor TaxID=29722 RepID=UPI00259010CE|nr:uncharacterized protein LOC130808280 [Amaranthus tricolor]
MGNTHSASHIRSKFEELEGQISSLRSQLSSTQATLSSNQAELSLTKASLKAANEEVEKHKQEILIRNVRISKLFKLVELQEQVSCAKVEALLSKFTLEASRKEVKELEELISSRKKFEDDIGMKLERIMGLEKKVSLANDQLFCSRANLEALKKEEGMLRKDLESHEKFQKDMEVKLKMIMKLEKQISHTKAKILSSKCDLEALKKDEIMLKEKLQACEKYNEDKRSKFQKVMELEKELSYTKVEGLLVKFRLEASRKEEEGLKKQVSALEKYQQGMEIKLMKILEHEKEFVPQNLF